MMNPLELWEAEMRRGVGGQDREKPSTWNLDALWRAACWWSAALESDAMFGRGAGDYERERALAELAEELGHARAE